VCVCVCVYIYIYIYIYIYMCVCVYIYIYMNNTHVHNFNEYLCEHSIRGKKNYMQASGLELTNVILTTTLALDASA
jgi:hypothetical protein